MVENDKEQKRRDAVEAGIRAGRALLETIDLTPLELEYAKNIGTEANNTVYREFLKLDQRDIRLRVVTAALAYALKLGMVELDKLKFPNY
jgi:S-adenosylmethionine synthetase